MKKTSLLAVAAAFGAAVCLGAGLFCPARTVHALSPEDPPVEINETNFPDADFRDYISDYDIDNNGSLSASEISCITEISISGVSSLKGIEKLTSLRDLDCCYSSLSYLDVSQNKELVDLHCYGCNLPTLNLTSNVLLERLTCGGNTFTSLDVRANTKLTYLSCQSPFLQSIDLSKNAALETLSLDNCPNLTSLNLTGNPNLRSLSCTSSGLTGINVTKNYKLKDLDLRGNQLTLINLRNNTKLEYLKLESNSITSLDLSRNTNLVLLYISYNPLSKLDVSKNTMLALLDCSETKVTELNISQNTCLRLLRIYNSNISVIDISHCPDLIELVRRGKYKASSKSDYRCYENLKATYYDSDFIFSSNMKVIFFTSDLTGLSATSAGYKTVKLSWEAVGNASGYLIYGQKNGVYSYIGKVIGETTFTDKKALADDYNYYWVFPYIQRANGSMIAGNCAKYTFAKGVCPAVTNLKASSVKGGVKLTWTASAGAEGYLVYGIRPGQEYGYIGMTTKGTTFTDTKASSTQYNYYWVFPYSADENGKMVVGETGKYTYGRALK